MNAKEQQLWHLIETKQSELDHYEACLRREARELAEREELFLAKEQAAQTKKKPSISELNLPRKIEKTEDLSIDQAN